MPMRSSSLANNPLAITRELDGRYDVVLQVRDNLDLIEQVAGIDFAAILAELESAQDFTGITVVQGETVAWDAVNKILTVPKGDKGDKGDTGLTGPQGTQGIQGLQGIKGDTGLKGDTGSQGPKGFDGAAGAQGLKGDTGDDLTITQIIYNGNGTFNWLFSDGTTYMTPDLKGPKGDTGDQGIKGDQGISVHHLKGTSTTNPNGDFGTSPFKDTYTFYGDADETLNLGWFVVTNGFSDGMSASVYDGNANGIVDNSERLGGELPSHYVNVTTDQTVAGSKTFAGNVVVQGDLTVSGNVVSVDVETVTVKDNLIVLNSGEVGAGVTVGEAGIIVDRGTEVDYKFVFDEASDSFKIGEEGSLQKVATREDSPINGGVAVWDTADNRFKTTKNVAIDTVSIGGHTVSWNTDESTLDVVLNGATLQVGQEQLIRVTNNSGVSIDNGTVVMATGTLGNSGRITVAKANLTQTNARMILGVVTETIANGADGFVTAFGKVRGIQTNGVNYGETWVDGDVLYVKDSGNGALTKVVPTDTQVKLPVAIVISAHGSNGTLFVRVNSIDENHAKAELALKANINSPTLVTPNIGVATGTSFNSITGLASVAPLAAGTAAVGVSTLTARQDHVHPIQTTVSGNAGTATTLATARNITLSGDASGTASFNGSADASIVVVVADNSHAHTIANVTGLQTALDNKVDDTEKGSANGVATLDVNGKVTLTQIPDSVLGQLEYLGTWDFTTMPTATQKGQYWIASVSGNGYIVGDWAVWNGSTFDKVDNTDAVVTVAGRTGNVVLTKSDVALANVDNTSDVNKPVSTAQQTAIDTKVAKVASTDNAVVRFNGTTGDVQNSGVIIDDGGNVGIGVTPSAWDGNKQVIEMKGLGSGIRGGIASAGGDVNYTVIFDNTYYNNGWKYIYPGAHPATAYLVGSGQHIWRTAPSGTAGNAITWTNAMSLDNNGNLLVGAPSGATHTIQKATPEDGAILYLYGGTAEYSAVFTRADGIGHNDASTALRIRKNSTTGRSINAAGTINASGADYAEYEYSNDITITKGQIVGFRQDGTLTDKYNDSIRFAIKSTNPSIVGGDTWGIEEVIGKRPEQPVRKADKTEQVQIEDSEEFETVLIEAGDTDAEWEAIEVQYKIDLADFEARLETERQNVDRIAYAGKVPVNVYGATAGQYIVAIEKDGGIDGLAVNKADMTFAQYQDAVGRVNKILDDGRAEVAVIIH